MKKRVFAKKSRVERLVNAGFLLSIGIASLTKEKVEKIVMELVKKGKLNEKQGRAMVREVMAKGKKEREKIKKILRP